MQNNSQPVKSNLKNEQYYLKRFLQFVGNAPHAQNALFMLYTDEYSSPEKLLNCYKSCILSDTPWSGMLSTFTQIDNKSIAIFALNSSFLKLKEDSSTLTDKDLIMLYLLRKYQKVKFCFCFDKGTITDVSFRDVKQQFEKLAYIIEYESIAKCSQSFMILVIHNLDKSIIELGKTKLQSSITNQNEKDFYKEIKQFAKNIINSTVKENKFMEIHRDLNHEQMQMKMKQFEKMISSLQSIELAGDEKAIPISKLFLTALIQKSGNWKFFNKSEKDKNLNKSEVQKTQSSINSKNGNDQIQIQHLFTIWQEIFKNIIEYVIKKLKNPQQSFQAFHNSTKFLLDKPCDKYKIEIKDLSSPTKKKGKIGIDKIFSRVLNSLQKMIINKQKNIDGFQNKRQMNRSVESFLQIFYQSNLFGEGEKAKTLFDSFKIYFELFQTLYPIQGMQLKDISFFQDNSLFKSYLYEQSFISRNFLQNLSKIFIRQSQIDINKAKNGQFVQLDRLSIPMKKIKQHMEKLSYDNLPKQRILETIKLFQQALMFQKIQKSSKDLNNKIKIILESMSNETKLIEKKQLLIELVKSILNYLDQNKLTYDNSKVPLKIKNMFIEILALQPREMSLVIVKYQNEFESIFRMNKKVNKGFNQLQEEFVTSFVEYLIKVGFVQKSREIAHLVGHVDQTLSNKLLLKSLLKTNYKRQFQFIKNQPTNEMKSFLNNKLQQNIKQIDTFFKYISQIEEQNEHIDSVLLDI